MSVQFMLNPNLKVAYEDSSTFGNFHGKFQPARKRWRHDSRGAQSRADAVKFASRIHYANPRPPPPPGHLRPLASRTEGVSRFQQLRFERMSKHHRHHHHLRYLSMSGIDFHPILFWRGWYARLDEGFEFRNYRC